jgi:hypothetical protein
MSVVKEKDSTIQEALKLIGDPNKVSEELQDFRRAARVFSSSQPRFIDKYSKQWIAVHQGKVRAQGRSFRSLLGQLEEKKLPRESVMIRYIDKNERTFIL